jgi:hypothetical protein
MPGTTLNSTIHTGITLGSGHASSPYTIASHGAIEPTNNAAYGIFADSSRPFDSVANSGIVAAGTSGTAIQFATNGDILNAGTIAGAASYPGTGIYMSGGGTVTNTKTGLITAYRIAVHGLDIAATVDNAGTIAGEIIGIRLSGGGLVDNESGGIITGDYAVQGHINASSLVNAGTITGIYNGAGLYGGQITNLAGGTIAQTSSALPGLGQKTAAYINNGTGTITNYGLITGYYGAALLTGGLITNKAGGTIAGAGTAPGKAAYITGGTGTIINAGTLQGAYGAVLEAGGGITNAAGGSITGGVQIFGAAGYITNAGHITGDVLLGDYGTITNLATITGRVLLEGGTLTNSGVITANPNGVTGEAPATIINNATGTITGAGIGIFLSAGGTVENAGTIRGTGTAIEFSGDADARLILHPGALLIGTVAGGGGINLLELAPGTQAGTISALAHYTGFTQIQLDAGAAWTIGNAIPATETISFDGTGHLTFTDPASIAAQINDFVAGDTIDLAGFTATSKIFGAGGLTLSNGSTAETLDIAGNYTTADFTLTPDGQTGTDITTDIPCFCAGTNILTTNGEVPIESIKIGDLVSTPAGPKPVIWTGHRRVNLARYQDPENFYAVRIRAGAFAENVPHRDLLVTQDHCLLIDAKLIPARMLVNHRSITLDRDLQYFTVHHLELTQHGILLAENLPAESYLDTGNRSNFSNAASVALRPDFALNQTHKNWQDAAAPLTTDRATVEPIWQFCADRAENLAFPSRIPAATRTTDPDLRILTPDAKIIRPLRQDNGRYLFLLPAGVTNPHLISRTFRPSETIGPFVDDRRTLGVLVGEITLHQDRRAILLTAHLDTPDLPGWLPAETIAHRWTNGLATLPMSAGRAAAVLEIRVVHAGPYRMALESIGIGIAA